MRRPPSLQLPSDSVANVLVDNVEHRAEQAQSLLELGELSSARLALDVACCAPRNEQTIGCQNGCPAVAHCGGGSHSTISARTTRSGGECVAHAVQALTEADPSNTILSVDGGGAFDLVSRGRNDVGPSQDGGRRSRIAFRPPILRVTVQLPLG